MSAKILQVLVSNKPKILNTSAETFDFLSVKVGPTALEIKEAAGHFDFSALNITNVGTVDGRDVSADGGVLDGHVGAGAGKHNDTQIAYTRVDGSKKAIQAASDSVDLAINDLDDLKLSRSGALAMTGALNMGGFAIGSLLDPTTAQQAATKQYVDSVRVFSRIMGNVNAATTANITLANEQTIDTYAAVAGDIILVKEQTDPKENGVYVVVNAGAWTRHPQLDNSPIGEIYNGVLIPKVLSGSANIGKAFVISSVGTGVDDLHTIGVDNIVFSNFTPASNLSAGNGINTSQFSSNVVEVQVSQLVGDGIEDDGSNNFRVKLDGGTLARSASGMKVASGGISATELAANAVAAAKLNADVAGEGIRLNASTNAVERNDSKTRTNDNAGSITVRQLVYLKSNGNVDLARANALATADGALGIVEDTSIATTASGKIIIRKGAVIGGFSGFTVGGDVYMSAASAGALTQTPPSSSGEVIRKVGEALSATEILFDYGDALEIL